MNKRAIRPPITIFSGRFGSGKTETAIHYALSLVRHSASEVPDPGFGLEAAASIDQFSNAEGPAPQGPASQGPASGGAILVDLDIVTPYFRSREMSARMREQGVTVIAPSAIGQHLDTPAITPQILGAIQQAKQPVVLDVGGDRQGARALGQFSSAIQQRGYTMYFVVNPYRPFTGTLEELRISIDEIEASARLKVSSLVSNPNLIGETTTEQILEGHAKIERYAQQLGLPIAFVCIERRWIDSLGRRSFAQPVLTLDRHFVMSWE